MTFAAIMNKETNKNSQRMRRSRWLRKATLLIFTSILLFGIIENGCRSSSRGCPSLPMANAEEELGRKKVQTKSTDNSVVNTRNLPKAAYSSSPSLALESQGTDSFNNVNNDNHSSSTKKNKFLPATASSRAAAGRIHDATCDVEQLEHANDSQLYAILHELSHTFFFRMFAVDLDHGCPLRVKNHTFVYPPDDGDKAAAAADGSASASSLSLSLPLLLEEGKAQTVLGNDAERDDASSSGFCSAKLPDFLPGEHGGQSACSITDDFHNAGEGHRWSPLPLIAPSEMVKAHEEDSVGTLSITKEVEPTNGKEDDDEDEFECEGSAELEDEPLCEIKSEPILVPLTNLFSSVLRSIADAVGWESESQERTFGWTKPSNPVIATRNDAVCEDEDGNLPDNFWIDMCSNIKAGEGLKIVNLQLNAERNTGYNGTHIWKAIYEENCVVSSMEGGSSTEPLCYEERVLYRLLSALHTSTTIAIAKNFYPPSKRLNRATWEPKPDYFMEKFANHPEYIRNLHFGYVVLLRALRKAKSFLYKYEITTGDILEDEKTMVLLRRLLDSHILQSCQDVFTAFDESLMFKESFLGQNVTSLRKNFKGVFHNVSSILDCVQCQQCKLHGKMAMLGYGAALKILFLPEHLLSMSTLDRNEVVAFINTAAKMSESLKDIRHLTHQYWADQGRLFDSPQLTGGDSDRNLVDATIGAVSQLNRDGKITDKREAELVRLALNHDVDLLTLVKHYGSDLSKFLQFTNSLMPSSNDGEPDAVVIGSGLAGLTATLNILDRGGKVVLIEKEHRLGGNSAKASSGINGCCPLNNTYGDSLESFLDDTVRSAGRAAQLPLIATLTGKSAEAVQWLKSRAGVDLSLLAQLGGHSRKRTHRPNNGMAGAEIIYGMQKAVKEYERSGMLQILTDTRVNKLIYNGTAVTGVQFNGLNDASPSGEILTPNVVLATGGFASDRSNNSYLARYRPELLHFAATAGDFSTGDGVTLATQLGAGVADMDKVQIHPTGWVDPTDSNNPSKVLAAELMRGVGGVLVNDSGKRFCDELGTRAYVTDRMLSHNAHYKVSRKWDTGNEVPIFSLVLSSSAAEDGRKHVDLYSHKGLLTKIEGVGALAEWMKVDVEVLRETLEKYKRDAAAGVDEWGKSSFRGIPASNLDAEIFFAGKVTPVLHYCMGGITIDTEGSVLDENKQAISGLHAAGEVSGGVHGDNRLGGNSLLECTVYGTIVGKKIPVKHRETGRVLDKRQLSSKVEQLREISVKDLSKHSSVDDCWVAVFGDVYDLTEFAEEHPSGAEAIHMLAGTDGTNAFQAVHNRGMLDDFKDVKVGVLKY